MDPAVERFVAALLSQNPGSELVERSPSALVASVPLGGVRAMVVALSAGGFPLSQGLEALVARAQLGIPLHIVVVHDAGLDVRPAIEERIKPVGLQMKQIGGWSWVPGEAIVSVRGLAAAPIQAAAAYANAHPELSLARVAETIHHEASRAQDFLTGVMRRKPVVSWALAAVCVVVFGLQYLWGQGLPGLAAGRMGGLIPSRVLAGEWWRLFAVMLLHGNVLHLAMNMLGLLSFGPFLERLIGSGRYLALFVLSGLGGALLSLTRGGDGLAVGASGGIWGLMVAGAVVVTWPRGLLPAALAHQLRQRAWTPVGINLVISLQPGIDMLAHVGGGLAGAALVYVLTRGAPAEKPLARSMLTDALAVVVGLLLVGSMGLALAQGRPWALNEKWELVETPVGDTGVSARLPRDWPVRGGEGGQYTFGEILETGAEVIVLVQAPLEGPVDDEGAALDATIEEMKKDSPEGMRVTQPPQRRKLPSGQEAAFTELVPENKDDVRFLWMWWVLEDGRRWVMVIANALNTTSDERKQQLVEIADSVK